ncbi:MAG: sigma-70 family RNA polymerase sigma factor [Asticcacaulis sp.]|jgi:RNA polymerase sigma-70 factor (ECF subfamily)|uniref:sigma-70 family RNA polymerase sigma factor n=1 Tax=Asticcacaulis sp. TaxID=1872648 RepID=UPI0025BFD3D6|nr:sigma-70 family RNA polymerase sigma factor [Asticcacaulis sp.]MCA1935450.1 sigma-70 family RNA polymerase sigma factor [Asticcacaulis sp.]
MSLSQPDLWQQQMHAAQRGDAEAYRALLTALRPWLSAYFRRRLQSPDTEDLTQITLVAVHEKRHTYDPTAPFMPWIAAVARHKLIDHVRKYGRYVHVELNELNEPVDEASLGLPATIARRDVQVLLSQLPVDQARVIRLHKVEELSLEDVSRLTGKSVAAVKVIVHRGLKKLRDSVGVPRKVYEDE